MGVNTETLYYEKVIEQDTKTTLKEHYGFGEASIEQFWKLEGENICREAYTVLTDILMEKANNYTKIIGDIES